MPGANRHRPPTNNQLLWRIYRKQIADAKLIGELKAEIARLNTRADINLTLAGHCRRLMAEKATMLRVIEANEYMSAALPRRIA